jgi:sugar lactone lactonase YvrE
VREDGSYVYFIAGGVLAPTATPRTANSRVLPAGCNLYLSHEGTITLIARLAKSDIKDWEVGLNEANVTPEGRFLVFTSHRVLTADDTRSEGPAQVYRYDSQSRALV